MSDVSSSIPPCCDICFEEFTTLWSINDVVKHFNNHLKELKKSKEGKSVQV